MGCASSKLDDLPPVALCRDRCKFLDDALRYSLALSDSHLAYMKSLKTLGPSLHRFFDQYDNGFSDSLSSKIEPFKSSSPSASPAHSLSSSNSDSHIQCRSDSEGEDSDKEFGGFTKIHQNYFNHDETRTLIYDNDTILNYGSAPPPPSNSAWDFLNFFDTYERYQPLFGPNSDRECVGKDDARLNADKKEKKKKRSGPAVTAEHCDLAKHKAPVTVKNAGEKKENPKEMDESADLKSGSGKSGVTDVIREVAVMFERASETGNGVSKALCYLQNNGVNPVVSGYLDFEEDVRINSKSLYSSLKKLSVWENKLYAEVKAEEKLRMVLEKKCRKLKQLDKKRVADARKVESTLTLIRNLSTKLQVSVQVVDRLSITISSLRDEELWTHITDLIRGLHGMWRAMLECHNGQLQALAESKSLEAISSYKKLDEDHVDAALQLKFEFQNWNLRFSNWIITQKNYVKALNGFLLRCLLYEPEGTPDSMQPFSPGRIGAPSVFVICNQWSQALDNLSEKEVIQSIQGFINNVDMLLEQHNLDAMAKKDMEKVEMTVLNAGEKSNVIHSLNAQSDLKQIFKAVETFVANSTQTYDELCKRIEENRLAGEEQQTDEEEFIEKL